MYTGQAPAAPEKSSFAGFDVVLMDAQMPERDGFEDATANRDTEKTNRTHLLIVFLLSISLETS